MTRDADPPPATVFVALLTAAAHRRGKALVAALAEAGGDLAIWSLARLTSRAALAESLGRRALALRFNANDPASVALALAETRAKLGPIDLVVHVAAHELHGPPARFDACTLGALPELRARAGAVLYLLDPGDPFPRELAAREREQGLLVAGLGCPESAKPEEICAAAVALFRAHSRAPSRAYTLEAARAV